MNPVAEIQATALNLLQAGQVSCVIGYESGPRGRTRPAFIHSPAEVERLIWDQTCTHNLTVYIKDALKPERGAPSGSPPRRVAVLVKPCDSRAINVLEAENQIPRERVHVIGVMCPGILDIKGSTGNGQRYQKRCLDCNLQAPVVYDTLIGEHAQPRDSTPSASPGGLERLEAMAPAQRLEFWLAQFDRCIRCYACRQVCPMCNCPTCLYERDDSLWVGMQTEVNEKRSFHLGRAFHLAGRCVGCGECARVCPMDIPIGLLNQALGRQMQAVFEHRAGYQPGPSPFTTVLSGDERGV